MFFKKLPYLKTLNLLHKVCVMRWRHVVWMRNCSFSLSWYHLRWKLLCSSSNGVSDHSCSVVNAACFQAAHIRQLLCCGTETHSAERFPYLEELALSWWWSAVCVSLRVRTPRQVTYSSVCPRLLPIKDMIIDSFLFLSCRES